MRSDQRSGNSSVEHGMKRPHPQAAARRAAMMVIMRATVSDFDERVNEVVERVAALEARTS